jgi:hypothetical protein
MPSIYLIKKHIFRNIESLLNTFPSVIQLQIRLRERKSKKSLKKVYIKSTKNSSNCAAARVGRKIQIQQNNR